MLKKLGYVIKMVQMYWNFQCLEGTGSKELVQRNVLGTDLCGHVMEFCSYFEETGTVFFVPFLSTVDH